MKKKVNILCTVILLVLCVNFAGNIMHGCIDFYNGFKDGYESAHTNNHSIMKEMNVSIIRMIPLNYSKSITKITNAKTGKETPVCTDLSAVFLDYEGLELCIYYLSEFCSVVSGFVFLAVIVYFIRFIRKINKQEIFTWKTVSMLRQMGRLLLVSFLFNLLYYWGSFWIVSDNFALDNHIIDWFRPFSDLSLILGLVALVISEVFAMGLRLQEDQDLTI